MNTHIVTALGTKRRVCWHLGVTCRTSNRGGKWCRRGLTWWYLRFQRGTTMHTKSRTQFYFSMTIGAGSQVLTTCRLEDTNLHSSSTIGTKFLPGNVCSTGRTRCHFLTYPFVLTNMPSLF